MFWSILNCVYGTLGWISLEDGLLLMVSFCAWGGGNPVEWIICMYCASGLLAFCQVV